MLVVGVDDGGFIGEGDGWEGAGWLIWKGKGMIGGQEQQREAQEQGPCHLALARRYGGTYSKSMNALDNMFQHD
jgi:hypothetical protein